MQLLNNFMIWLFVYVGFWNRLEIRIVVQNDNLEVKYSVVSLVQRSWFDDPSSTYI